jgi:hypothetical protein
MEFLEYKSNAWGQQVLQGVSWDLLWLFVVAGGTIVVVHATYVAWRRRVQSDSAAGDHRAEQVDE